MNETTSMIAELVANLGAVGAVVWLVYHVFTQLLPKRDEQFSAALKQRDETLIVVMKELNADRGKETDRLVRAIDSLEDRLEKLAEQVEQQSKLLMLHDLAMRPRRSGADLSTSDLASAAGLSAEAITSAVRAAAERSPHLSGLSPDASRDFASRVAEQLMKTHAVEILDRG